MSETPKKLDTSPEENLTKKSEKPLPVKEIGGQEGPDPTRFGDWEKGGRCTDF